jgi:serine/threonine protein kinase
MENGSLDKYIFSPKGKNRQFRMERLLAIAMGVAEGMEYLHQGCDHHILHFDIKPHNILMDHNFVSKISEMYSRNFGAVSYKSDVYSFGMLVLEMIRGRKNSEPLRDGDTEIYFSEWIHDQLL